jgi:hypothetical protein
MTVTAPKRYYRRMFRPRPEMLPDLLSDPFGERSAILAKKRIRLLGGQFHFGSNSRELMRLVDSAYAGLPRHRLSAVAPRMRVRLLLRSGGQPHPRKRLEPPPLGMVSGAGFLGGATDSSNFVILSPQERTALVVVSPQMLRFAYHTRYELIEFAVFTLAARVQGLVPLHAACVGRGGRGLLLMGPSGAGKSTVALQCLLHGLDFLAEDSVFVAPDTMLATGIANFLHVRADSLRWLERDRDVAAIRKSPVIRRRSGVKKFELDLRSTNYRLAASPLKIESVVYLTARKSGNGSLLRPLPKSEAMARLAISQAYAANQPQWPRFGKQVSRIDSFELRRGDHPLEAIEVLRALLARRSR